MFENLGLGINISEGALDLRLRFCSSSPKPAFLIGNVSREAFKLFFTTKSLKGRRLSIDRQVTNRHIAPALTIHLVDPSKTLSNSLLTTITHFLSTPPPLC